MKLVIDFYDKALEALNGGADIERIVKMPVREAIGRFKYVEETGVIDEFETIEAKLDAELKEASVKEED